MQYDTLVFIGVFATLAIVVPWIGSRAWPWNAAVTVHRYGQRGCESEFLGHKKIKDHQCHTFEYSADSYSYTWHTHYENYDDNAFYGNCTLYGWEGDHCLGAPTTFMWNANIEGKACCWTTKSGRRIKSMKLECVGSATRCTREYHILGYSFTEALPPRWCVKKEP